jgi:hypothetical protein
MAARWRQMMANPPRPGAHTRPDMLDPRELVRTAFYPKKWATLYSGRAKVGRGDDRVLCLMLQLEPRVGFRAKKKELDTFKAAIEQYEADPEMNPLTVMQVYARVLACGRIWCFRPMLRPWSAFCEPDGVSGRALSCRRMNCPSMA